MKDLDNVKSTSSSERKIVVAVISLVLIISICIVISLIHTDDKTSIIKEEIAIGDAKILIEHSKDDQFLKEQINSENETVEMSRENDDYVINLSIDKSILKNQYMGDFQKYKEIKTSGIEYENIATNSGIQGFGYYKSDSDEYQIILPYKNEQILNIIIKPKIKFKDDNAKTIFEREEVQKVIKNIKI